MKTIHQYFKDRVMRSIEDHEWYKSRQRLSKVSITILGVEEFIGPTGVMFDLLIFTAKTGGLIGKFSLNLDNNILEMTEETNLYIV